LVALSILETDFTVGQSVGRTKAEFARAIFVPDVVDPLGDRSRRGESDQSARGDDAARAYRVTVTASVPM
jgi:hypothetical protein